MDIRAYTLLYTIIFQVFYLEACESGSIFEGLLPNNINIYATTAANAMESSYATYCPGMFPSPPPQFTTCLGDLYSVSWMEDRCVLLLNQLSLLLSITHTHTSRTRTHTHTHIHFFYSIMTCIDDAQIYCNVSFSLFYLHLTYVLS